MKKNQINQIELEKIEFLDFCPYSELNFKTKDLNSWLSPILLYKIDFFSFLFKHSVLVFSLCYMQPIWSFLSA